MPEQALNVLGKLKGEILPRGEACERGREFTDTDPD